MYIDSFDAAKSLDHWRNGIAGESRLVVLRGRGQEGHHRTLLLLPGGSLGV